MKIDKFMKLYLTLEDGHLRVEREMNLIIEEYNPHILAVIEDMQDTLRKTLAEIKESDLALEANRLAQNTN